MLTSDEANSFLGWPYEYIVAKGWQVALNLSLAFMLAFCLPIGISCLLYILLMINKARIGHNQGETNCDLLASLLAKDELNVERFAC